MRMWQAYGFFGGHVFLDFVNTIEDGGKTRATSALESWREVADWAAAAGLADGDAPPALHRHDDAPSSSADLTALLAFRETAWRVLSAVAHGRQPDPLALEDLAEAIRAAVGRADLVTGDSGFRWRVGGGDLGAAEILRDRLALALDDLLTRRDLSRLKECGRCTGLFLDRGRGLGRRWCRMKTCGNRAKVEAFRDRSAERG